MACSFDDPSFPVKLPSSAEMAVLDLHTIEGGVPSLELMERAGEAVFEAICGALGADAPELDDVLIFCGPGNNGGDGLVLAQRLRKYGREPQVVIVAADRYSNDCRVQAQKLNWAGGTLLVYGGIPAGLQGLSAVEVGRDGLRELIGRSAVIVDALLGSGQRSAPHGTIAGLIADYHKAVKDQRQRPMIVAVDVPTGINPDTGAVFDQALAAELTVSIELVKRGMVQYPARSFCGEIVTVPIGIEQSGEIEYELIRPASLALPERRAGDFHKAMAGHVFVLAGSANMPGASYLTALAALRSGAGLVTAAVAGAGTQRSYPPEVMLCNAQSESGFFTPGALDAIEPFIKKADIFVIGPGVGTDPQTGSLLLNLLNLLAKAGVPAVIDADGLNLLSALTELPRLENCVLTPHPGEMGRLLKLTTEQVQGDRFGAARELFKKTGAVTVLKGPGTLVYCGKAGYVNTSGNPYMGTAGSGDVLAGVLAALVAQMPQSESSLFDAARTSVYVHGRAGDMALDHVGGPIVASDILHCLPRVLGELIGIAAD